MTRQPVETAVIPKQRLSAGRHVLMSEWTSRNCVEDSTPRISTRLIFDQERRPIAISFQIASSRLAEHCQIDNPRGLSCNGFQILFNFYFPQLWHRETSSPPRVLYVASSVPKREMTRPVCFTTSSIQESGNRIPRRDLADCYDLIAHSLSVEGGNG